MFNLVGQPSIEINARSSNLRLRVECYLASIPCEDAGRIGDVGIRTIIQVHPIAKCLMMGAYFHESKVRPVPIISVDVHKQDAPHVAASDLGS